jgi:hypothetical protein
MTATLQQAIAAFSRGDRVTARTLTATLPPSAADYGTAQRLLALLAYQEGGFAAAVGHAQAAIAAGDAVADELLAAALMKCDRPAAAIPHFRAALARAGENRAQAEYNLAMALLAAGDWAEGWQRFEARWRVKPTTPWVRPWEKLWDGSPLAGRHLLAHAEQGFGDTLQFVRYLPLLRDRGARITLAAPPPLLRLLRASLPGIAVITKGDDLPRWDVHVPLMSLPRLFGTTPATVPATVPYLDWPQPDPKPPARPGIGPTIGIVWAGNRHDPEDRYRSLPPAALAALLARLRHGTVVSLQHEGENLLDTLPEAAAVVRRGGGLRDFADTAAVVAGLDLVITVDTAVAHLAGALGRPVWLLLAQGGDWRWLAVDGPSPQTSLWYPTMRLFRQPSPGDWDAVLAAVGARMAAGPTRWD